MPRPDAAGGPPHPVAMTSEMREAPQRGMEGDVVAEPVDPDG
jgi:hypothetical protein